MENPIRKFSWHEFFPQGNGLQRFLDLAFEWTWLMWLFCFCSQEQYWCCDCSLVSYHTCLFPFPSLHMLPLRFSFPIFILNMFDIVCILLSGIFYGYPDLVCNFLHTCWWHLWGLSSSWRGLCSISWAWWVLVFEQSSFTK